jgi:Flp pilus assembly pilin Flp
MRTVIGRLLTTDDGQDIIEYALLAALIATLGIVVWQNIGTGILNAYTGWVAGVQNLGRCTPDPGGAGC